MEEENERTKQWTESYDQQFHESKELKSMLSDHDISIQDEDPLILMVIEQRTLPLFFNFLCSLDHHSISGVQPRILVVATDSETETEIKSLNVMAFRPQFVNGTTNTAATSLAVLRDLIEWGYNVVVQHPEVVWTQNVFAYLKQSHFDRLDVQMMSVDSGFMFLKHSCKMKRFLETAIRLIGLVLVNGTEHAFWSMLLHEDQFRQIHIEVLDDKYFIGGSKEEIEMPETAHLVKASGTADGSESVLQLNEYGVWYFNELQCPHLFRSELMPNVAPRGNEME